ncbi:MAG: hypothetical protein Q9220_006756 [cf. Caloplaca sp. 1 TL-2023]
MFSFTIIASLFLLTFLDISPGRALPQVRDVPHLTLRSLPLAKPSGENASSVSISLWPQCPFAVPIQRRKGRQQIIVTENDYRDYGQTATDLAFRVCRRMTSWMMRLPPTTIITENHWEKESYGELYATEFTVFMELQPEYMHDSALKLDRELAYFATDEFCALVGAYGAMQGEFEYWGFGKRLSTTVIHVFKWPQTLPSGPTS